MESYIKSLTKNWCPSKQSLPNKKQEETLNEARTTLLPKQRHCKKKGVLYTTIPH